MARGMSGSKRSWADAALSDDERIARIDALAGERPADDAVALFERAGARDSAGLERPRPSRCTARRSTRGLDGRPPARRR